MYRLLRQSQTARTLLAGACAFFGYGAWAFYANAVHGHEPALKAFFTQGGYSFVITLITTSLMETIFQIGKKRSQQVVTTVLGSLLFLYSTSWGVNVLAGTPEIFLTILPGMVIGGIYTLSYTLTLSKLHDAAITDALTEQSTLHTH